MKLDLGYSPTQAEEDAKQPGRRGDLLVYRGANVVLAVGAVRVHLLRAKLVKMSIILW